MNTANCVPSKLFLRVGNIAFYYHYKKLYLALWWISVIILFSIARMQQCSMRKSMFKAKVYKKKICQGNQGYTSFIFTQLLVARALDR